MPVPTYKPWTDGRGQPVMIKDPDGHFVTLQDYRALEQRFFASNRAIAVKETTTEEDDAKS